MTAPTDAASIAPLFSVVVPTHGRPHFLQAAVDSVLAQTVTDLECIVVDDASPTPVRPSGDARLRVLRRAENGGPAAARNTGLENARGRYVAFLDDDDLFTPDRLSLAVEGLARAPVAICGIRFFGTASPRSSQRVLEGHVHDVILDSLVPHLGQTVLRRDVAVPFDERYAAVEDLEWWLRVSEQSPVATVARVGYLYRRHDEPRHLTGAEAHVRYRRMLLRDHREYFATRPAAAAFQWKRIGLFALKAGERGEARRALLRSLRIRFDPSTARHLLAALQPDPPRRRQGRGDRFERS